MPEERKNPLREIVQPFIEFRRTPRALWGVIAGYFLEGIAYWGGLAYLALYFNEYGGLDDVRAGWMTGALTWGITFAMFFLGSAADRLGARRAILIAFTLLFVGRIILSAAPSLGFRGGSILSGFNLVALGGIVFVVLGYGLYQPMAYAAVRLFTVEKTAAMGYAMLYAVNNLGGWLPSFAGPIRHRVGMSGVYWIYAGSTGIALIATMILLTRKVVAEAAMNSPGTSDVAAAGRRPFRIGDWIRKHPMMDAKFSFFIFSLIPVQTLFAHTWLTIPAYVKRAYDGTWLGDHFEVATNFNPLLIFLLVPFVAAATQKAKVYNMMIAGTLVMAAPAFLLAIGASFWTLLGYLVIMTIGEAMWQPRFMQYAAAYIGVAQFPWFLTKMITSLYSGWFLRTYCPEQGPMNAERMWFYYALIAMASPVLLLLARGWVGKDFKAKAAE